ncbi:MAG: hypothetical protein IPI90_12875 [Saprospiraceae bacterium]|nr:hypothetical protein [Candidatus Vicinibacter affinis]
MGRQSSLIKVVGTLDDLNFYKTADGHLVRMKGGVSGDRIKNDPAFARTRENMEEFKEINKAGKIIRGGFRNLIGRGADPRASSRLVGVLSKIMKYDTTSLRGERKVGIGLIDAVAKSLLSNFNFNQFAELDQILKMS